ncbi:MAG: hypothetical protein QNJ68_05705 [Microcoleaceae cyanobacterium MO_207.B10]|nr:hypothetical protein [Microcoleaceae cyanobacterium MO_207.B10]
MELIEEQIIALSNKVEATYSIIEQLNHKISTYILEKETNQFSLTDTSSELLELTQVNQRRQKYNCFDPELEHKDVLVDDNYLNKSSQNIDGELTTEIQIQRLTAQLTAAYNRIAALEEQLLSIRIKS